ncbi:hypothetical protein, partial [Deinococcus marmoris]|uniref:hypothetical protein n=1 Tax=Deinococcus marmoris TaxID=249408 RepID=UPI001C37AC93
PSGDPFFGPFQFFVKTVRTIVYQWFGQFSAGTLPAERCFSTVARIKLNPTPIPGLILFICPARQPC